MLTCCELMNEAITFLGSELGELMPVPLESAEGWVIGAGG